MLNRPFDRPREVRYVASPRRRSRENTRLEEEFENGGGRRDDPEVASPLDADAVANVKEAADSTSGVDEICHESEVSFAGDTCSEEEFENGAGRREDQEVASPSDAVADPKDAAAAAVSVAVGASSVSGAS